MYCDIIYNYYTIIKRRHPIIRVLPLILVLAVALSFAGCEGEAPQMPANEIVIWHWMSDRIDAFEELAKEYKEKTGINVKFELYAPTTAYTSKIRSAAQADKLPDI